MEAVPTCKSTGTAQTHNTREICNYIVKNARAIPLLSHVIFSLLVLIVLLKFFIEAGSTMRHQLTVHK